MTREKEGVGGGRGSNDEEVRGVGNDEEVRKGRGNDEGEGVRGR